MSASRMGLLTLLSCSFRFCDNRLPCHRSFPNSQSRRLGSCTQEGCDNPGTAATVEYRHNEERFSSGA